MCSWQTEKFSSTGFWVTNLLIQNGELFVEGGRSQPWNYVQEHFYTHSVFFF